MIATLLLAGTLSFGEPLTKVDIGLLTALTTVSIYDAANTLDCTRRDPKCHESNYLIPFKPTSFEMWRTVAVTQALLWEIAWYLPPRWRPAFELTVLTIEAAVVGDNSHTFGARRMLYIAF